MLLAAVLVGPLTPAPATNAAAELADTKRPRPYVDFVARSVFPPDVVLTGVATDNIGVHKVRVSIRDKNTSLWLQKNHTWGPERDAWTAELSTDGADFVTWTHRVTLPAGKYRIDVRAKDAAGNVRRLKPRRTFFVDPAAPAEAFLAAAGDIARCTSDNDEATATILDSLFAERSGFVGVLGDSAYEHGTATEFAECYDPTWGRHRDRTRPAVGNHEYHTDNAGPYFDYFGVAAGPPGQGWYAYDHGEWRIIVLNSNCPHNGGCGPSSPQGQWLTAELANHPTECSLAMTHHPRFSSGTHGDDDAVDPLWDLLVDNGVELMLSGHDHHYERFKPMNGSGIKDLENGVVQFVVGTGGTSLRPVGTPRAKSKALVDDAHGVLAIELGSGAANFAFHATSGGAPLDSGTINCH